MRRILLQGLVLLIPFLAVRKFLKENREFIFRVEFYLNIISLLTI